MIDINELRRLAQEAMHPVTKGRWMRLFGERTVYDRMEDGCRGIPVVSTPVSPPRPFEAACLDFIAAANPAAVIELLDRLEEAEKERDNVAQQLVQSEIGKHDISEAHNAVTRRLSILAAENTTLRAKLAEMEQQEPVGTAHTMPGASAFTMACFDVQDIPVGAKLYALPGTHPKLESSVPDGWKLVPIEPTTEIRKAMHYAYWQSPQLPYHDGSPELWNAAYAAMLEAAPEAK